MSQKRGRLGKEYSKSAQPNIFHGVLRVGASALVREARQNSPESINQLIKAFKTHLPALPSGREQAGVQSLRRKSAESRLQTRASTWLATCLPRQGARRRQGWGTRTHGRIKKRVLLSAERDFVPGKRYPIRKQRIMTISWSVSERP